MKIFAIIALFSVFAVGFAADGADGGSQILYILALALVCLSITGVISAFTVFYLYRRRDSETEEQASAPPEAPKTQPNAVSGNSEEFAELKNLLNMKADAGADAIKEFAEKLQSNSDAVLSDTKNTLEKIRELFDGYMTLQKALEEKDTEIKRLKGGYDAEVFRRFLVRFIRIDKTVDECLKSTETPESALKNLRLIQGLFEDALDESGVEKFSPKIGEDYQKTFGIADRPETEPTTDAGKDSKISEVLGEGYMLKLPEGGPEAVVPAKVKIYKHQKEN